MNTNEFEEWFNNLVREEDLQDVKFALGSKDQSVRELKNEFKRLHSMVKAGITLPLESTVPYLDPSLDKALQDI
ncbi:MAG: hypothetical protein A6F71_01130 [Cycloclasticus sp. symbiont of Poecilosclerida sp. M]|nr:MAG: hypothetical protein A6F71_01130 [Cycloclasticus sp. symbiont of Poecilosclerida sp. M]